MAFLRAAEVERVVFGCDNKYCMCFFLFAPLKATQEEGACTSFPSRSSLYNGKFPISTIWIFHVSGANAFMASAIFRLKDSFLRLPTQDSYVFNYCFIHKVPLFLKSKVKKNRTVWKHILWNPFYPMELVFS